MYLKAQLQFDGALQVIRLPAGLALEDWSR
jgi:hypothetical protein